MAVEKFDAVIVGAGFAGAATAFHLSEHFRGSILVIEREEVPGVHASGRNASLILQTVSDPVVRRATARGQAEYARLHSELGFRRVGSLLLGGRSQLEQRRETELVASAFREPSEVRQRIPLLEGHSFDAALETPGDGVIDIWALLQYYLAGARARGVTVRLQCEVTEVSGTGPFQLVTSRGQLEARTLVNAAGAWATRLAAMAGAASLPLVPFKRHLVALEGVSGIDREWPFVWSFDPELYFRPEERGLLFSPCDEEPSESLVPTVSPEISARAAALVWEQLPELRAASEREIWSCFRTKSPDGRYVIGWDPCIDGFFWVAALGGSGVGSSWEVGRVASQTFLERGTRDGEPFAPERLLGSAA